MRELRSCEFGTKSDGVIDSAGAAKASRAPTPPPPILPRLVDRVPVDAPGGRSDGEIALDLPSRTAEYSPTKPCYECKQPMSVDSKICMGCGYNTRTGRVEDRAFLSGTNKK